MAVIRLSYIFDRCLSIEVVIYKFSRRVLILVHRMQCAQSQLDHSNNKYDTLDRISHIREIVVYLRCRFNQMNAVRYWLANAMRA